MKNWTLQVSDLKLWQRLLLVALTGTVPLFMVAVALINASYSGGIDAARQEKRGIAFQRPLEQLLDLVPRYQAAARQAVVGDPAASSELAELRRQIDQAMNSLAVEYNGALGRALKFTDAELTMRKRDNARLSAVQANWRSLESAAPAVAAHRESANQLLNSIRTMIVHTGDLSNLILDTDLDSYYLMDITLCVLPQAQQRLSDITLQVGDWLHSGLAAANQTQIAVLAAIVQLDDQNRITRDAQTSLTEDRNFYGVSKSLQKNLPPAIEKYTAANQVFLVLLKRLAAGGAVSAAEFEAAGWNTRAESFHLWQVGADELDRLLSARVRANREKRLQAYLTICATLVLAAGIMGWIIRSLLNARFAELRKTEEALRAQEARLRALGDNLPNGVVYQILREADGAMRFLHVSAGIERLNGLTAGDVLRDASLLHNQIIPEDLPGFIAARQNSLIHKSVFNVTLRLRRNDGEVRWMQFSSAPRRLPDGCFIWDGIETDITDQKHAEARIQALNRTYAVLSGINQTIVHKKTSQVMLEAACRIAVEKGKFRMAWIGMVDAANHKMQPVSSAGVVEGYLELLNIDLWDKTRIIGPAARCFFSGEHTTCHDIKSDPLLLPWRDEALRRGYRSSACFPLKIEGQTIGIFSLYASEAGFFDDEELRLFDEVAEDIGFALAVNRLEAERQLAGLSLLQSEERFSRVFKNSPIPITITRMADGAFIDANEKFLCTSGFTRDEVIGHSALELNMYPDPSRRAFIMEQLHQHGHLYGHDQLFRTKSGLIRNHVLWFDVMSIGGEPCLLVIALDVTEQKQAEQQQQQLEEQLRQAQKLESLGTLAGGIAHDFNNILGAIISYAELAKMDHEDDAELQDHLSEVLKACKRATNLVRQILSFSRQQTLERKHLQLTPVIKEVLKLLRATLPATIRIQQSIDGELPNVLADPTQIHQIVMNLCTNAAHAMRGKQGELWVRLEPLHLTNTERKPHAELREGVYLRLIIRDTGHGMDEATLKRIFEPFFTTKGPGEGTGLGLSVVHGIVKEHEGVITVQSEPGRGTTFAIYLPAQDTAESKEAKADTEIPNGNGERILFVDDEAALGEVAQKMLRRLGYQPFVFSSPEAAWRAVQENPAAYDLVISDLTMPVLTGADLAKRILNLRPDLPVILTSGASGTWTPAEVQKIGIRELVGKPLNFRTLALVVHAALRTPRLSN
jgi:PAS domain S-box-containing protein